MKNVFSVLGVALLLVIVGVCGMNLPCDIRESGSVSMLALFGISGVFLFVVGMKKDNRKELRWKMYL